VVPKKQFCPSEPRKYLLVSYTISKEEAYYWFIVKNLHRVYLVLHHPENLFLALKHSGLYMYQMNTDFFYTQSALCVCVCVYVFPTSP